MKIITFPGVTCDRNYGANATQQILSRFFRDKYLAELKQLWEDGQPEFHGTAEPYQNESVKGGPPAAFLQQTTFEVALLNFESII